MNISITETLNQFEESATLAINQNVKYLKSKNQTIYHLGFGESPFPVSSSVIEGLHNGERVKSYLPTQGLPELREKVSKFYQHWFGLISLPENIFIGPGSKELIFDLMLLIRGDLLLPVPSWVSYIPQATLAGKKVKKIITTRENNYCLTVNQLDEGYHEALKEGLRPGLLLINSPGNPCANSYSDVTVKQIAEYAREKELIIISDEIYANVIFKGFKHTSFAKYYPEGTFVTGGISKDRSLGGYRLGVCLVPEGQTKLKKAFNSIISETFSCVSSPVQYAGIKAYSTESEITDYINDCTIIHNNIVEYFYNQLISFKNISCSLPMGAFYLYPEFHLNKISNSTDLANLLLNKYNVATLPGKCFGDKPEKLTLRLAITDYSGEEVYDNYLKNDRNIDNDFIEKFCPNLVKATEQIHKMIEENDQVIQLKNFL